MKLASSCDHEIDPVTVTYNKRSGRQGVCVLCGKTFQIWRIDDVPKRDRPHMTKKERRRSRAARRTRK